MDIVIAFVVGVVVGILVRIVWKKHGGEQEAQRLLEEARNELRDTKNRLLNEIKELRDKL